MFRALSPCATTYHSLESLRLAGAWRASRCEMAFEFGDEVVVCPASQLGATGMPLFVVGDRVINSAVGYEGLKDAIEAARKG